MDEQRVEKGRAERKNRRRDRKSAMRIGGCTFPECHRGGGDLNCAGNKMEMRVVEWKMEGGIK